MELLLNERIVGQGQEIKMIVVEDAPADGQIASETLDVAFVILDDNWTERPVALEEVFRDDRRSPLTARTSSAFRIAPNSLPPGLYHIRATLRLDASIVGVRDITVLPEKEYRQLWLSLLSERFPEVPGSPTEEVDLAGSWNRMWGEAQRYLAVSSAPHISMSVRISSSNTLQAFTRSKFEWLSFHLNRFIFDRAVFGAAVSIRVVPVVPSGDPGNDVFGTFTVEIRSAYKQPRLAQLPFYVPRILNELWDSSWYTRTAFDSRDGIDRLNVRMLYHHG